MKRNPVNPDLVSDELYNKTIGEQNSNPEGYTLEHKTQVIHMIDAVSRGYISPMEAYDAVTLGYVPAVLLARPSKYQSLV